MPRYVVLTDDASLIGTVQSAMGSDGTVERLSTRVTSRGGERTEREVSRAFDGDAGVLVIGGDVEPQTALELAARVDLSQPQVATVLVAAPTGDLLPRAMRAGVRDVLEPDASPSTAKRVLDRATEAAQRRNEALAPPEAAQSERGRVYTVLSPKGGSGKTTVAVNFALALAASAPGRVVLIDGDLQFGDVTTALGLEGEHHLGEAIGDDGLADPATVKALLTLHPAQLLVLAAPPDPGGADAISGEHFAALTHQLAEEFDHVIVDTSAGLPEETLAVIEVATELLLVASLEVPSIKQVRKLVEALDAVGLTMARRHLVLNRADSRVGLARTDIEAAVGLLTIAELPSAREVPLAMNSGVPIVLGSPRSTVAREFIKLAAHFVPASAPPRRGLFGRG